ncbi:hypothetical protein FDECE_15559 [Fusarium decemcellulare]|nr:hypothetical protein FDECE_15559 [Fusarium decemcellulare]
MMLFDLMETSLDVSYQSWRLAENADQVEEACLPLSVVGCAALPLAFKALDIKLRQGLGVEMTLNRNERQDDVLSQVVEICKPRHTAIEWLIEAVEYNTTTAYQRLTTIQFRTENSQPWTTSWTQVLRLKPRQYLYLIAAMDFSISRGKLPGENDLPASLRDISTDVNFGSIVSEAPTLDLATAWMLEDLTTGFKGANQLNNREVDNKPFRESFGDVELAAEMGMIGDMDSLGDMTLFGSPFAVVGSAQLGSSTTCENSRKDRDAFEHDAETTATDSAVLPVDVIDLTEPSNLQRAAQTIQPRTNSPASISTKHSNVIAHQEWGLIEADPAQWGHAVVQGDILSLGFGIDYASLEAVRGLK